MFLLFFYLHVTQIVQSHAVSSIFSGQFRLHSENRRLTSTFKTLQTSTITGCQNQCVLRQGLCESYNYMKEDKKCELSSDIFENENDMEQLSGWVHYEKDVSPKYSGKACVSKSACPERDYCESKLSYPYYECLCKNATFNNKHCPKLNSCQNGHDCIETCSGDGHKCKCSSRYFGKYCAIDILNKCSLEMSCYPCICDLDENLNPICNCDGGETLPKPVYHIPFDTYDETTKTTYFSIGVNKNNEKTIQLDNQAQSIVYDEPGKGLVLHLTGDLEMSLPAEDYIYQPLFSGQVEPFTIALWVRILEIDTSTVVVNIFTYARGRIFYRNIDSSTICFAFNIQEYQGLEVTEFGMFNTKNLPKTSLQYWTHLAVTWNGEALLTGYVNGTKCADDSSPFSVLKDSIAEAKDGLLECKDCYISSFAVWKSLLDVNQINRVYNLGIPKRPFVILEPRLTCKDAEQYCMRRGKTMGKFKDKDQAIKILTDSNVVWVFAGCKINEKNEVLWFDGTPIDESFTVGSGINNEGPCCEMGVDGTIDDEESTTKNAFVCE